MRKYSEKEVMDILVKSINITLKKACKIFDRSFDLVAMGKFNKDIEYSNEDIEKLKQYCKLDKLNANLITTLIASEFYDQIKKAK